MKRVKLHTLFSCMIGIALCCASCSDEYDSHVRGHIPATFTTSIAGSEATVTSRASNASWAANDKVGIHMSGSKALTANAPFKSYYIKDAADAEKGILSPSSTSDAWLYPIDDSDVWFYAFYPYGSNAYEKSDNTLTFTMPTNQSEANAMENFDYLYYKNDKKNYSGTYPHAALAFEHKFSKVIINVTKQGDVANFTSLAVSAKGFPGKATCDLGAGTVVPVGTSFTAETTFRYIGSTDDTRTYEAIIIPHTATAAAVASFTGIISTLSHPLTKETFESGKAYTYNFRLSGTGVMFSGASISDWSEHSSSNGTYYLAVSDKALDFDYTATAGNKLMIETNSKSEVKVSRSSSKDKNEDNGSVSWLTLKTKSSSPAGSITTYTQVFDVSANTDKTARATAYLWVEVDDLQLIVTVNQAGDTRVTLPADDANCYIVKPGTTSVPIPITRAKYYSERYDAAHPSLTAGEKFTPAVLWSDVQGLITSVTATKDGPEGTFTVTTASDKGEGNAVVVVRNSSGHILWSWHIWVVNYEANSVKIGEVDFMSRNLGATSEEEQSLGSLGLLYQWGRKDPFTGASVFEDSNTSPAPASIYSGSNERSHPITYELKIGITSSLQLPSTFFACAGDWAPASDNQSSVGKKGLRWGPISSKALDDPCPRLYKVPTCTQLRSLQAETPASVPRGWLYGDITYTPLTGQRRPTTGDVRYVGSNGYLHSCDLSLAGFQLAGFCAASVRYKFDVAAGNASERSAGISIRCTKL